MNGNRKFLSQAQICEGVRPSQAQSTSPSCLRLSVATPCLATTATERRTKDVRAGSSTRRSRRCCRVCRVREKCNRGNSFVQSPSPGWRARARNPGNRNQQLASHLLPTPSRKASRTQPEPTRSEPTKSWSVQPLPPPGLPPRSPLPPKTPPSPPLCQQSDFLSAQLHVGKKSAIGGCWLVYIYKVSEIIRRKKPVCVRCDADLQPRDEPFSNADAVALQCHGTFLGKQSSFL